MTQPTFREPWAQTDGFVAVSDLVVDEEGREALMDAFTARLGAVDAWPGFRGLQVWADSADRGKFVMVSWWDDHESFSTYMRSDDHHRSHERIPDGDHRPRPRQFRRYDVIAR